jgi:hypothetical protein
MSEQHSRTDTKTEAEVREALAIKRAFGDDTAQTFLKRRGIGPDLAERVISAPPGELRY